MRTLAHNVIYKIGPSYKKWKNINGAAAGECFCNAVYTVYNCKCVLWILDNCYSQYVVHKDSHLNQPSSEYGGSNNPV